MKAGKAQLETLLNDLKPTGGAYTACMKDVYSTWDIMHAFSSEPTLQKTVAKLLIVVSDTRTLTFTDVEVVIRGHALTFVECRFIQQSCYGTSETWVPTNSLGLRTRWLHERREGMYCTPDNAGHT